MRTRAHLSELLRCGGLFAGVIFAGRALVVGLQYRIGLEELYGARIPALHVAIAVGLVANATALLRCLRGLGGARGWIELRTSWSVTCLALFGMVVVLHPFRRINLDLGLGAVCALPGLCEWLFVALRRVHGRELASVVWLRRVDFLLLQAALLLVLVEGGLRIAGSLLQAPILAFADAGTGEWIRANRLRPGFRFLGSTCNEFGYHDGPFEPASGDRRPVVVIGDSFGVGIVPHPANFTTVCERELGDVDVYNMSVAQIGLLEYRYLLRQEALLLGPRAVVVAIFVSNDLSDRVVMKVRDARLRRFFDRDNLRAWVVTRRVVRVSRGRSSGTLSEDDKHEEDDKDEGARASGRMIGLQEARRAYPWMVDWRQEGPAMTEEAFLACERNRALEVCTPGSISFDAVFAQIDALREAAAPVPLYFVLIPDEFQVEDALWQRVVDDLPNAGVLQRDLPQRELLRGLAERGADVLDLLPLFREEPLHEDGWRHLYHLRDTHWNAAGNRVAGEALARFLAERLD